MFQYATIEDNLGGFGFYGDITVSVQLLSIICKLSGEICTFKQDSARQTGHVKQSTILPVTSPNVYQF